MNCFQYILFRLLYWLRYRRRTRRALAEIIREMDEARNMQFQPLRGRDKANAAFFLAVRLMRGKKNQERKALRALEWAVQAEKGRRHQSSHMHETGLHRFYSRKRWSLDKPWGLESDEDAIHTRRLVRAVEKERAARTVGKRKKK